MLNAEIILLSKLERNKFMVKNFEGSIVLTLIYMLNFKDLFICEA